MSTVFIGKEYDYNVRLIQLINEARADGIVIEINTQARYPLAAGNFDMIPAARYSRSAKATKLWMLNIEGPDDIFAAPSFMDAIKVRDEFNAYWLAWREKIQREGRTNMDAIPMLRAVIHEWDGDERDHAANFNEHWLDMIGYGEALEALKFPALV